MENHLVKELAPFLGGFPLDADEEGYLTLRIPRWGRSDEIPFIALGEDFGDIVHGVLLDPSANDGKLIQALSESATPTELVEAFERGRWR
jgi:hypothetical protein